jgi:hypothetical protein
MIALRKAVLNFRICLVFVVAALCAEGVSAQESRSVTAVKPDDLRQLWSTVVDPVLRQTITGNEQGQNFGTTMMLPLYAAFRSRDEQAERAFSDHFSRMLTDYGALPQEDLGRLQYLYVASQLMVLAKETRQQNLIPRTLPGTLYTDISRVWTKKPAWQWERKPFPGGIRERILWKLDNRRMAKNYYRSINDVDLFVFAIAADLKNFITDPAEIRVWTPTLDDILGIAHRTFTQEVAYEPGGGWLFQPGVWADHPEFQYAGNRDIHPGMKPAPMKDISGDSSHFLRYPLWLTSLMHAYPENSENYRYYQQLRNGLEKQVFDKVLVKPSNDFPCYRMNNYMNGWNGVYRWNYESIGPGGGFGPYGLSSSLLQGWWVFLGSERIKNVYRDLDASFPWSKQCIEIYLGPTTPKGHPDSAYDPNSPSMRLWHLNVKLASRL